MNHNEVYVAQPTKQCLWLCAMALVLNQNTFNVRLLMPKHFVPFVFRFRLPTDGCSYQSTWYFYLQIRAALFPRSANRVPPRETSVVSANITASSAKSRSVIRTVPNDTPQPNFSDILPSTWSMQVLKSVGARTHP